MNIRQAITRNITYTKVFVECEKDGEGMQDEYIVYGNTTPTKEMKKLLRETDLKEIPKIVCETITEKRAISIENFINNSIIINESEEN